MKNVVWDEKKVIYDAFFTFLYKKGWIAWVYKIVYVKNWVNLVVKENIFKAAMEILLHSFKNEKWGAKLQLKNE